MQVFLSWLRCSLACLLIAGTVACACPLAAQPTQPDQHACCHTGKPQPPASQPCCNGQHDSIIQHAPQIDSALATLAHAPFLFTLPTFSQIYLPQSSITPAPHSTGPPGFPQKLTLHSQRCQFLV